MMGCDQGHTGWRGQGSQSWASSPWSLGFCIRKMGMMMLLCESVCLRYTPSVNSAVTVLFLLEKVLMGMTHTPGTKIS